MSREGMIPLAMFLLMGIAVLLYLFLTGTFLTGEVKASWENAVKEPLNKFGVEVENFALFIGVSIIFGLGILLPIIVFVIKVMSR